MICFECIAQHQLVVNNQVQENFNRCKESWNLISEKSSKSSPDRFSPSRYCFRLVLFDEQHFDLETYLYELRTRVEKRANFLVETMEKGREIYQKKIQEYSEKFPNLYEEITREFQVIDQQIDQFVK